LAATVPDVLPEADALAELLAELPLVELPQPGNIKTIITTASITTSTLFFIDSS
jgi:hypothetical protein